MKISIPTKQLLAALATLKPIAKPSTTHPILGNVAIVAEGESVTLTGTDMEKQLSIVLSCKVKEPGSTTIPASKLHDSLSKMRAPECSIETTAKHETTVRAGTAVTKLLGLGMEDMPQPIEVSDSTSLTIPAVDFNRSMERALMFAHADPSSASLCSVILLARNGKLNAQATNRKACIICAFETPFTTDGAFVIPRESVPSMVKLATEGDVILTFGDSSLSVKTEGIEFRTKLIESNMPEFEQAYPKDRSQKITTNREELAGIVEYAEIQTSEVASYVILDCDGKTVTARGAKSTVTDGFMDMNEDSAKVKKGSAVIEVKVNPSYLRNALKCITGDDAVIELVDNITPVVIQEDGVRISICPMRIN